MIKLSSIPQFSRNAKRFKEIVAVLLKYGLANWISRTDPAFVKDLFRDRRGTDLTGLGLDVRIRLALSELGTTFIKLGQMLSTRPDLIGPDLARELEQLQSDAPSDPPEVVREIIGRELGRPVEEVFAEFEDRPVASASMGQVHLARTKDGPVVVKVQHAGIQEALETDLEILIALADLAEKHNSEIRLYQPRAMVAEFKRSLLKELDFKREARHLNQFRSNFRDNEGVVFPRPHKELTTPRVLTMERLSGFSMIETDKMTGLRTDDLARTAATVFLDMIFRHGFYHADPHPGNIWVLAGGAIGILDCGQTGRLDQTTLSRLEDLLFSTLNHDIESLTETICRLSRAPGDLNKDLLRADLDDLVAGYIGQAVDDMNIGLILNALVQTIHNHHLTMPANISLVIKAIIMLEGTTNRLSRSFNLLELLQPYAAEALRRRYSPGRMWNKLQRSYRDWDNLLGTLPNDLADILALVRAGKFDVNLAHRKLDPVVNRMIYGLLTAALFLGSCLVLAGEIPPLIQGVSVGGALGALASLGMGWRLIRAIHKSGHLK